MYKKLCCKSSTLKNEKSNSNVNITKILHLPFDMLCYSLRKYDGTVQNAPEIG